MLTINKFRILSEEGKNAWLSKYGDFKMRYEDEDHNYFLFKIRNFFVEVCELKFEPNNKVYKAFISPV